jgi:hypothetical protein
MLLATEEKKLEFHDWMKRKNDRKAITVLRLVEVEGKKRQYEYCVLCLVWLVVMFKLLDFCCGYLSSACIQLIMI